jgi:hypothetical protein
MRETIKYDIAIVICSLILALILGIYLDSVNDVNLCSHEFKALSGLDPLDSFANDDFFVFNFGRNIQCTVFWYEEGYLTEVTFGIGTLTQEKIMEQRYWLKFEEVVVTI